MDVSEDLDREVIVERAEALRAWLAGFGFSGRTATALERELQGIIANDPGGYINGQRPLAGYTVAEFVAALHSRNGGAVGQVKSVGDAVLKELRAAIPPDAASVPEPEAAAPEPSTEVVAASDGEPAAEAPAQKRRGRPKGSTSARKNGAASAGKQGTAPAPETQAPAAPEAEAPVPEAVAVTEAVAEAPEAEAPAPVAEAPAPKRRGRPKGSTSARKSVAQPIGKPAASSAPAPTAPAEAPPAAPPASGDIALGQLVRLWPGLHPQARRAVVLYASELLAEAAAGR